MRLGGEQGTAPTLLQQPRDNVRWAHGKMFTHCRRNNWLCGPVVTLTLSIVYYFLKSTCPYLDMNLIDKRVTETWTALIQHFHTTQSASHTNGWLLPRTALPSPTGSNWGSVLHNSVHIVLTITLKQKRFVRQRCVKPNCLAGALFKIDSPNI